MITATRRLARIASGFLAAIIALLITHPVPPAALAKGTRLPADVQVVHAGDIDIGYRIVGEGPPLVLIMGFAGVMDLWDPTLVEALAQQYQVVMFDNRGMGFTSANEAPFSIPQFADDTAALMDALGIERAHVLGWSMGTYIAQELALRRPDRVDHLILYAGDCGGDEAIPPQDWVLAQLQDSSGTDEERGIRLLRLLFPSNWIEANADYVRYVFTRPIAPSAAESVDRQVEAMALWEGVCDRLSEIDRPTLIVTGTEDVIVPPDNSRIIADRIPNARLVELPYGGHGLMYQFPETLVAEIEAFLQQ